MGNKQYIDLSKSKDLVMEEVKKLRLHGYVVVGSSENKLELEYSHAADRYDVLKRHYNYLAKDDNIFH